MEEMKGIAQALAASGGAESSLADQSSAFTVEESADKTLAPVREVSLGGAEGDDAVQSVAQEDVEMKTAPSATDSLDDDDEKMEEAETTTLEDESYAKKASRAVWKVIESLVPGGTERADLKIDDKTLLALYGDADKVPLLKKLNDLIEKAYKGVDESILHRIWRKHDLDILASVKEALSQPKSNTPTKTEVDRKKKQLATAFTGTYSGSADDEFQKYLARCCKLFRDNRSVYLAPYVAITQSSGFGKSRVLSELAKKCASDVTKPMRLLYVCARDVAGSTGFPVATPELVKFLFERATESEIASRLLLAFDYACKHWGTVQKEWLEVFSAEGDRVDEKLASKLKDWKPPTELHNQAPDSPVLVLVIDEARSLLAESDGYGVSYFRLLRRALNRANADLLEKKLPGIIFGVVVDTNSQIHDFVPPSVLDPSSRADQVTRRLFPPFVLTQTMDVFFKEPIDGLSFTYKNCVLETNREKIREMLLSFGRPLWYKHYTNATGEVALNTVLALGGGKLLNGSNPSELASYNNKTLHGVAAVMCRLGLRPQSGSPFASQLVANFMAALHAVKYTYDAHISGYVSEPFLAFAATHMWYEEYPESLTNHMLPQLRELMMQGIIDVGYVGEMVARLFLLLAMDTAIMGDDEIEQYTFKVGSERFEGQFCSVSLLLSMLDGSFGTDASVDVFRVTMEFPDEKSGGTSDAAGASGSASGRVSTESGAQVQGNTTGTANLSRDSSHQRKREPSKQQPGRSSKKQKASMTDKQEAQDTEKAKATKPKKKPTFKPAGDEQRKQFDEWMKHWDEWSVGFSHFVELTEVPTKATLWCLLGRRAAGVFPRGQAGADLIIPIFRRDPDEVSFMLVQVKNEDGANKDYPHSALGKLSPANVFKKQREKHELVDFSSLDVVRIYISLRESNRNKPARSYLIDATGMSEEPDANRDSYTLCLRGICKDPSSNSQVKPSEHWRFLDHEIWEQLKDLAESAWWDPMKAIKDDLRFRKKNAKVMMKELPDVEVLGAAKHTLELLRYEKDADDGAMRG
ncbi:hypothetical protein PR003_g17166 [Phytophthora rubi]|nr:hypothetical protein PR002_g16743 [Phytophthora rubi]KAE9322677.1 hypothetical protein PR003_g17166 [Phytophthora rubi]